jgi:hypothetical protein
MKDEALKKKEEGMPENIDKTTRQDEITQENVEDKTRS